MEEIEVDPYDTMAKNQLSTDAYKGWELLWQNDHLVKSRDYWLAIDFLETFEDYKQLKKDLKPKRKTPNNPNPGDPRVHENSNGTVQTSPIRNQLKDVQQELRRLASELGLSPTAAANLKIMDNKDKDIIVKLLTPVNRAG